MTSLMRYHCLVLIVAFFVSFVTGSPISLGSRDISSDLLANFNLYEQFAAAAYCPGDSNLTSGFGTPITCPTGNCPLVSAAQTTSLFEFDNAFFTDVTGYVGLTHSLSLIILAFRGSKSLRNFLTDGDFILVPVPSICPSCHAHQGFYDSWLESKTGILAALTAAAALYPSYTLVVTGHSLGAAIADLAAAEVRNMGIMTTDVALYTFGSPRVGDKALSDYVTAQAGGDFRVTHTDDPVPRLPPIDFGYAHTSPEYWITAATGVAPGTGDVQVLTGDMNTSGNAGQGGFDVVAHGWYLGPIGECSPSGFEFR